MSTEIQKVLVRNIDRESLIEAILERDDIVEIMQMFKDNSDYAPREYMTIKEFCEYIKASESYVRNLAKHAEAKKIFSIARVGREYRIDRLSYEKWAKNNCF